MTKRSLRHLLTLSMTSQGKEELGPEPRIWERCEDGVTRK
jgi:hypothetical protein